MEAPGRLADWWCSLYTLFLSNKGLKLRISIPDTFIVRNGALSAWFQTSDDGYVVRLSPAKLTPENVYKTLVRKGVADQRANPNRYVAIAHFARHASRLLRKEELDVLLGEVDPPGTPPRALTGDMASAKDLPYCIQLYVPPEVDLRYVTTYSMDDGASCTTFARRFSSRYTHAHDEEPIAPSPGSQPSTYGMRPNSAIPSPLSISDSPLQSPSKRGHSAGSNLHGGYQSRLQRPGSHGGYEEAAEEEIYAAANHQINEGEDFPGADLDGQEDYESMSPGKSPKMEVEPQMRAEIRRLVQAIASFIERAHGLRLIGMVCETIRTWDGRTMLLAVHATQWDTRHTNGSITTYTERMNEYRAGKVAPPAAQPNNQTPIYVSRSGAPPPRVRQQPHLSINQLPDRQGIHDRPWTAGAPVYHPPRVYGDELPGIEASGAGGGRPWYGTRSVTPLRPDTTPAFGHGSIRPGAGGSPTTREILASHKTRTWSARTAAAATNLQGDMFNRDVVAGLADDLEATKECLQLQYDACARSEAALQQLHEEYAAAVSAAHQTQTALEEGLLDTQRERNSLRADVEELSLRNESLEQRQAALEKENQTLKEHLGQEREAAAAAARHHGAREAELREKGETMLAELKQLREERSEMQRRITQEQEVVQAVRTQLVEYKLYIQQLEDRAAGPIASPPGNQRGHIKGSPDPPPKHEQPGKPRQTPSFRKAQSKRASAVSSLDLSGPEAAAQSHGYGARPTAPADPGPQRPGSSGPLLPQVSESARRHLELLATSQSSNAENLLPGPQPEISKASSINEENSQESQSMPVDIVPYIGLPTFADYLTPSHTNGFDDSYTFWDEIHIGDLLHAEGQPANRMKERQQAVIHVLKVTEPDLKDIYTFYCHLGRLILRGGRPTMGMGQFMKFARHTGCVGSQDGVATENEGAATQAQVEVVFTQVANSEVQDTLQGDHRYYFEGFLECVIRLACLKYGFDPKCDAADARSKAAEAHKTAGGGAPGKAKAAKAQNVGKKRPGDGSAEQQQAELCSKGPGQTDLVTTLKVFLYNDVLPRARRNKLSGSAHARTKTGSMTGAAP